MKNELILRELRKLDCEQIHQAFKEQHWNKPIAQYLKYLEYQESGLRDIIIAEFNGAFVGYLTIKWLSDYVFFRNDNIPEIVDFNVLKKYQRQGIGSKLMDEAENRIKKVSSTVGIGFGIYEDYGAAQILYIKRGYIPDGKGLTKNSIPIQYGEKIIIDDSIVFCLTKKL